MKLNQVKYKMREALVMKNLKNSLTFIKEKTNPARA